MLTGLRFDNVVVGFLEAVNSKQTSKLRHAKGTIKASGGRNPKTY